MIYFAQAQYLLLIFLIPVFFIIQALLLRRRRKQIRKFGDEKLVNQMMPSYSKSKVWVRVTLFSIGFFFFVIGLSRPQIGARLKEQEIKGSEIIIAIDVSNSMLAEDYSPNRLERAKLAVSRLVDKLRDDRIGLVIFAGTSVNPVTVAVITFGMNFAAYVSEMFRSAIESVDKGQTEAGVALGFTPFKTFIYIVLPQAFKQVLPVFKGETISLVKTTSIVGFIAVQDLTKVGDIIRSRTFDAFFPLIMVAILYFVLSWIFATALDFIGPKKK